MFDFEIGTRLVVGNNDSTQFDWVKLMFVPVVIYVFQNAASGILITYKKARLEMSLVENLIGDIINGVDDMKFDNIQFQTNLENKYFEKIIRKDKKYYIFMASTDYNSEAFKVDSQDFFFLHQKTRNLIILFYQQQALVGALLSSAKSDAFANLSAVRKLAAIRGMQKEIAACIRLGRGALRMLNKERNGFLRNPLRRFTLANGFRQPMKLKV